MYPSTVRKAGTLVTYAYCLSRFCGYVIGLLEKYHIVRHYVGHDSCVIVAAKYAADSQSLDKAALYPALAKLIQTHAALGVYLQDESTRNPAYARLEVVNLDKVVTFVDDDDLAPVMEREFLRPFDTMEMVPLWRLRVLKDNIVIFAYHHAIGDGKSGVAFHNTLLSALNNPPSSSGQDPSADIPVPPIQLVAPIEDLLDLSVSGSTAIRELLTLFSPTSWTKGFSAWTGNPVAKFPHLRTNCRIFYFSAEDSSQFLTICRHHKATLTSAFHVLAFSIIARLVSNDKSCSPHLKTIASSITISLRELANTLPNVMCDHVSNYTMFSPITQADFSWTMAAILASTLRSQVEKSTEQIGTIRLLFGNYLAFLKGMRGKKRRDGLELSNIGKVSVNTGPEDKWKIGNVVFSHAEIGGAAIKLSVVGMPEGGIGVSVTWADGDVADSFVESFISEFKKGYYELIGCKR
jgi:Alcohol acetyltransferase